MYDLDLSDVEHYPLIQQGHLFCSRPLTSEIPKSTMTAPYILIDTLERMPGYRQFFDKSDQVDDTASTRV